MTTTSQLVPKLSLCQPKWQTPIEGLDGYFQYQRAKRSCEFNPETMNVPFNLCATFSNEFNLCILLRGLFRKLSHKYKFGKLLTSSPLSARDHFFANHWCICSHNQSSTETKPHSLLQIVFCFKCFRNVVHALVGFIEFY